MLDHLGGINEIEGLRVGRSKIFDRAAMELIVRIMFSSVFDRWAVQVDPDGDKSGLAGSFHHEAAAASDIEKTPTVHISRERFDTMARPFQHLVYFCKVACRRILVDVRV